MLRYVLLSCLVVCAFGHAPTMLLFHGRIAGGETANIENYPYQLALFRGGYFICGASIVSETMAITAARCTKGSGGSEVKLRGTIHQVTKIHQHPGFDISDQDGDMSILEVDPPFQFGAGVGPIPLPDSDYNVAPGSDADVSGWGATTGDTGGPLAVAGKLIGVVSFGYGCSMPGYPTVYTRVTALRDWIKQEVGL